MGNLIKDTIETPEVKSALVPTLPKARGKTFLVYDDGLYVDHAVKLAEQGNEVIYCIPSLTTSQFKDSAPGMGMEGLRISSNFFEEVDKADVIMFPQIDAGDLTDYLRKMGYTVYGAGLKGEDMENDRFAMRKLQFELGLPTQKTILVHGIDGIRKFLKGELKKGDFEYIEGQEGIREFINSGGNVFCKLNKFRNDIESFCIKDLKSVETILDYIETSLGPFKNSYNFMLEEVKEGVEIGFDLFFNGTKFLEPYLWGYEKKSAYIGVYTDKLPKPLKILADALTPYLQSINYRGAISTECFVGEDGLPYLIDVTSRYPFPLSLAYTESIKNYSDVILNIALGNDIPLDVEKRFCACIPLKSNYSLEHWAKIDLKPEFRQFIKLSMAAKKDGNYYTVGGMDPMAVVASPISIGDSVEDVINKLIENVEGVNAHQLQKGNIGDIYGLEGEIEEGEKVGLNFKP